MRTHLSQDNPFAHTRAGYAWEQVARRIGPHLDFGCYDGRFLAALARRGPRRLVGIDANREAVEQARHLIPSAELIHAAQPLPLPFPDETFESITLLDVLEHVADQRALLQELCRVLRGDGVLIVTVPRQYALSIMDLGNLKFRLPRLHRWFYTLRHSREEYARRYVTNPDGLIGDVSALKAWHEHFTERHLEELLRAVGLEPIAFDGSAFWTRLLNPVALIMNPLRPLRRAFGHLLAADARIFASMNLFCTARKA